MDTEERGQFDEGEKNAVIFTSLIEKFFTQCRNFRMLLLQCNAKGARHQQRVFQSHVFNKKKSTSITLMYTYKVLFRPLEADRDLYVIIPEHSCYNKAI